MTNIRFYKGLQDDINSLPIIEGNVYFCEDTGNVYICSSIEKKQISAAAATELLSSAGTVINPDSLAKTVEVKSEYYAYTISIDTWDVVNKNTPALPITIELGTNPPLVVCLDSDIGEYKKLSSVSFDTEQSTVQFTCDIVPSSDIKLGILVVR